MRASMGVAANLYPYDGTKVLSSWGRVVKLVASGHR